MRKILLIFIPMFLTVSIYSQTSVLGGEIVQRSEYEAALPFCNSNQVRVRDLPNTDCGNVMGFLNKSDIVDLDAISIEKYEINGELYPWYKISKRHGDELQGWVYGKFISFQDDFPPSFWVTKQYAEEIELLSLNPIVYRRQILNHFFGTHTDKISRKTIEELNKISEEQLNLGFLSETIWTYSTDFGSIAISYRVNVDEYEIDKIEIDKLNYDDYIVDLGDSEEVVKSRFGTQYSEGPNYIKYWIDPKYDVYLLIFEFEDSQLIKIRIELDYRALI